MITKDARPSFTTCPLTRTQIEQLAECLHEIDLPLESVASLAVFFPKNNCIVWCVSKDQAPFKIDFDEIRHENCEEFCGESGCRKEGTVTLEDYIREFDGREL